MNTPQPFIATSRSGSAPKGEALPLGREFSALDAHFAQKEHHEIGGRPPVSCRSQVGAAEVVFFHLVAQGVPGDGKQAGGLALVSPGFDEGLADQLLFHFIEVEPLGWNLERAVAGQAGRSVNSEILKGSKSTSM